MKITAASLLIAVLFIGCSTPTPEAYLAAAVAAIDIASVLPGLTGNDRLWLTTAAGDAACSSDVLARGEPVAQETDGYRGVLEPRCTRDNVSEDNVYISAAVAAVEIFIALYEPGVTPVAVAANSRVRAAGAPSRAALACVEDE